MADWVNARLTPLTRFIESNPERKLDLRNLFRFKAANRVATRASPRTINFVESYITLMAAAALEVHNALTWLSHNHFVLTGFDTLV
jgi:hypothetical protein